MTHPRRPIGQASAMPAVYAGITGLHDSTRKQRNAKPAANVPRETPANKTKFVKHNKGNAFFTLAPPVSRCRNRINIVI